MPKPKTLLKEAKSKKKAKKVEPETVDEYLAEGVEYEEAGEKWRGGDAAKSMRFFMRALDTYDNGLAKYPNSFDLAYNKARVQYEITQHPKLVSQLPGSMIEILQMALQSHREALNKDQDNADILFNTAQVLTSLAEVMSEGKHQSEQIAREVMNFLQNALELFQRCFSIQELRYTEYQEQLNAMESAVPDQEPQTESDVPTSVPTEKWAAVVEPVTKNTLVDTAIAQLETLATLCGLLTQYPGNNLSWLEEYSSELLRDKINAYAEGTDRTYDVALARAKFISAFTEMAYRNGQLDLETYTNEINAAFSSGFDVSNDPDGLCSLAEALVALDSAVADTFVAKNSEALTSSLDLRWKSLTSAQNFLTSATKLPSAAGALPRIHIARGDVELHRRRLGKDPWNYAPAGTNAATLAKNAEVYYRGGAAIAKRDGWTKEEKEGTIKEALLKTMSGDSIQMEALMVTAKEDVYQAVEDMLEDGLITHDDVDMIKSHMEPEEIVF